MRKINIFRVFFFSGLMLLTFQFAAAQTNLPASYPDRIIMNPGSDAERSAAITWRTDEQIREGVLELQPSPAGPVDKTRSMVIKAKSTLVKYEYPDEPTIPQLMTPGNHDYRNQVLDSHWKYQFNLPDNGPEGLKHTCYFIDYKNLKIISIDSAADSELRDASGTALEKQKAWLDSILTMNTREWIILTTHLPFYSPKESRDNAHIRQAFQPIIEKHGVDMVLSGHDHSYGRGQASDNPAVKNPIVYVVSVSGPKMYEPGDKEWMKVKGSDIQLYHEISIDDNRLTFKAFTADGRLFDQFVLKKKKNRINRLKEMKNPK